MYANVIDPTHILSYFGGPVCVLDTEVVSDRIVEIALIRLDHGRAPLIWTSLIDPGPDAWKPTRRSFYQRRAHGIVPKMTARQPTFRDAAPVIEGMLANTTVVAHNVGFDRSVLCGEFRRAVVKPRVIAWECSMKLARARFPGRPDYSLVALAKDLGIPTLGAHRAPADAVTTLAVVARLLPRAQQGT